VLPWGQDESSNLLDEREYAILEFLKNKKKFTSVALLGKYDETTKWGQIYFELACVQLGEILINMIT
jgi:hypothetical protein